MVTVNEDAQKIIEILGIKKLLSFCGKKKKIYFRSTAPSPEMVKAFGAENAQLFCDLFGANSVYIPTHKIQIYLRNQSIYRLYHLGEPIKRIESLYDISLRTIYKVIKAHKKAFKCKKR